MIKEYGYEYDAVLDVSLYEKTSGRCVSYSDCGVMLLRSGRDALKVIARENSNATVFLPSLSCESMILPFRLYGFKIIFYKLLENYRIDYDDLINHFENENDTVVFLYMNYFGNISLTDDKLQLIRNKHKSVVFVEDRTHDLIYSRKSDFQPDYIVSSMRKWINVPDGGLLWTNHVLKNIKFSDDTTFAETRRKAQCMRNDYLKNGDETIKTEYRKIFSTVTDQIDTDLLPGRMSAYSFEMAKRADWNQIRMIREHNAFILAEILVNCKSLDFIQKDIQKSNLYVPILISDRNLIQKKLAEKGIYTTLIWPLSVEQKENCKTAQYAEKHMLGIPCDQRYSVDDMRYIGEEIVKVINSVR